MHIIGCISYYTLLHTLHVTFHNYSNYYTHYMLHFMLLELHIHYYTHYTFHFMLHFTFHILIPFHVTFHITHSYLLHSILHIITHITLFKLSNVKCYVSILCQFCDTLHFTLLELHILIPHHTKCTCYISHYTFLFVAFYTTHHYTHYMLHFTLLELHILISHLHISCYVIWNVYGIWNMKYEIMDV